VLRGGPDTADKLQTHALRTARAWSLEGSPLFGVSVMCALDDVGPAAIDELLKQMRTYRVVHRCAVGDLRLAGFELLATAVRPHFTVKLMSATTEEIARLLATFGLPGDNPSYRPPSAGGGHRR